MTSNGRMRSGANAAGSTVTSASNPASSASRASHGPCTEKS